MSHLHVPDGVLPLWLVAIGWVATGVLLTLSARRLDESELRRRIPLLGSVAALMLVAMASEIIPIAYHVNLTVVAGMLLGGWLSIPTAFVVVTILALLGHGGVTVIGINTLIIGTEMVIGAALARSFVRALGRERTGAAVGIATVLTLFVTTTAVIGIVALGGPIATDRESGAFDPASLSFSNPLAEGVFGNVVFEEENEETTPTEAPLQIRRFALMLYGLGSVGWVLEALVTAAIVTFVARVRPSLVFGGHIAPRTLVGDTGVHR